MLCYIFYDLVLEWEINEIEDGDTPDTFIMMNDLLQRSPRERLVVMSYFMFTTLSTVGLGDLHPRANAERIG